MKHGVRYWSFLFDCKIMTQNSDRAPHREERYQQHLPVASHCDGRFIRGKLHGLALRLGRGRLPKTACDEGVRVLLRLPLLVLYRKLGGMMRSCDDCLRRLLLTQFSIAATPSTTLGPGCRTSALRGQAKTKASMYERRKWSSRFFWPFLDMLD